MIRSPAHNPLLLMMLGEAQHWFMAWAEHSPDHMVLSCHHPEGTARGKPPLAAFKSRHSFSVKLNARAPFCSLLATNQPTYVTLEQPYSVMQSSRENLIMTSWIILKKAKTTFTEFVTCCRLGVSAWDRLTRDRMFVTLNIVTVTIAWKTRCSRMLLSYVDAILFVPRLDSNFYQYSSDADLLPNDSRNIGICITSRLPRADCPRLAKLHERTCIVS